MQSSLRYAQAFQEDHSVCFVRKYVINVVNNVMSSKLLGVNAGGTDLRYNEGHGIIISNKV